jgi:hypothetical protein
VRKLRLFRNLALVASLFGSIAPAYAQSKKYSCPHFFHTHQAFDCIEALFSEDPVHLIVGSVPPGNGFALGAVAERPTHFVSSFAPMIASDVRSDDPVGTAIDRGPGNTTDPGGYKSLFVPRVAAAVSLNGSFYVTGGFDWLPGTYKDGTRSADPFVPGSPPRTVQCHKIGVLCTEAVMGMHFYGTHRTVRTVDFYGFGPASPAVPYTFRLDETYGGVQARLPVFDALSLTGQLEYRQEDMPAESKPDSVAIHFPSVLLPGVASQPAYLHSSVGLVVQKSYRSERKTNDDDDNDKGPLFKHRTVTTVQGDFAYHWYADPSATYSFRQLTADANLSVEVGAAIRRYVVSSDVKRLSYFYYRLVNHYCGVPAADPRKITDRYAAATKSVKDTEAAQKVLDDAGIVFEIKVHDRCDFGTLQVRSHLVTSDAAGHSQIPFFMLPTVGGQDIDSLISLRDFHSYRFRGQDATFVQAEYTIPIYDPLGLLVFYDAGNAGSTLSALSFAHLRQDAGLGLSVRILRMPVAQVYLSGGSGSGLHGGFSLVKQF